MRQAESLARGWNTGCIMFKVLNVESHQRRVIRLARPKMQRSFDVFTAGE